MVKIRLTRVGATKQPTYRFVVTDSRNARNGRSLETIGHYNPRTDPIEINVDEEKAKAWLSKGAQPIGSLGSALSAIAKQRVQHTPAAEQPTAVSG